MDNMDMIDISEKKINNEDDLIEELNIDYKKKDNFMLGIYVALIILIVLTIIIYFFGYELFKPIIKV